MRTDQIALANRFLVLFVIGTLVLVPAPLKAAGTQFYVAPNGRPDGNGSRERSWDLATALAYPSSVKPGDTIWLRGGRYRSSRSPFFTSSLRGAPGAYITVRQYPGERAIIDAPYIALSVEGSWTIFRDFEIYNSEPTRVSAQAGPNVTDIARGGNMAISIGAANTKFINLIIHDTGDEGIFVNADIVGSVEIYGNLIYFTGYKATNGGYGHGIYVKNSGATSRLITENILFQNFGWGIHGYGESGAALNNLVVEGNISFNNGELALPSRGTSNILVGGWGIVAQNPRIRNNYTYFSSSMDGDNNLGYSAGCTNALVQDNYFAGGVALRVVNCVNTTLAGNTLYGGIDGFTRAQFPNNTYYTTRPTGVRTFVRANHYEQGRAHIAIYNWDLLEAVDVDVSRVLPIGTRYELRNAQDYFGSPVLRGIYNGRPLHVPMTGLRVGTPVGNAPVKPSTTGPEFAALVLIGQ